ncbi:transmembrane efflux protein [Stemphylium lycopersici]|uniref:Transmembrane efflux protein n=1 Tax=Stemphylium lycopersici TaxID=183478 RepID=A0A364MRF5_STELY|nr:transmembrane efflux protein [Stemphylium lycopersici]RAR00345.1 transmembrane efflux protein [Stemphylium lycopersici]
MIKLGLNPKETRYTYFQALVVLLFSRRQQEHMARHPDYYHKIRKTLESEANSKYLFTLRDSPSQATALVKFQNHMKERLAGRPDLFEAIIPTFASGCRRLTPGPRYLESLQENNVTFCNKAIQEFNSTGLKIETREQIDLDIVICATGYDVQAPPTFTVTGRDGKTLKKRWKPLPKSYLAVVVDKFPNFFIIGGPNSGLGSSSLLSVLEAQGDYAVKIVRKLQKESYATFEVRPERVADFSKYIDEYFKRTVYTDKSVSFGPAIALGFTCIASIVVPVTNDLGADVDLAWVVGAWSLSSACSFSLARPLSDIFGRRKLILRGQFVVTIVEALALAGTAVFYRPTSRPRVATSPLFPSKLFKMWRGFVVLLIRLFISGMNYHAMAALLPQGSLFMFTTDNIEVGLLSLLMNLITTVVGVIIPITAHKLGHIKWLYVSGMALQAIFLGASATIVNPKNMWGWAFVPAFGVPMFVMVTILGYAIASLHILHSHLGVAMGLLGTFRSAGGGVRNAIFNTVFQDKFREYAREEISKAALTNRLDPADLRVIIPGAIALNLSIPHTLDSIQDMTPAIEATLRTAVEDPKPYMTNHVQSAMDHNVDEKLHVKDISNQERIEDMDIDTTRESRTIG